MAVNYPTLTRLSIVIHRNEIEKHCFLKFNHKSCDICSYVSITVCLLLLLLFLVYDLFAHAATYDHLNKKAFTTQSAGNTDFTLYRTLAF